LGKDEWEGIMGQIEFMNKASQKFQMSQMEELNANFRELRLSNKEALDSFRRELEESRQSNPNTMEEVVYNKIKVINKRLEDAREKREGGS
jgi:hypothetical protein